VKRIWTPSWTIFSAGWSCWMLAVFYGTIDVLGFRRLAFPLVVVGVNSIAMYLMAQLLKPFIANQLRVHLGRHVFEIRYQGVPYDPMVQSLAITAVLWLICLWMYWRKIFVKI
jgi:predicted acyltransferase